MDKQDCRRFFILGCQRSGTTLMRLALECHPSIACLDETEAYAHLSSGEPDDARGRRLLGFKIPMWTERLGERGGDLPDEPFYRGEPSLFLLRDVRDTVASMMSLRQGDSDWMTTWGRSILEDKIQSGEGFRRRYDREIGLLRGFGDSSAAVGALYWLYKTSAYLDYRERGWPILGVSYEALVARPEQGIRAILEHLGVPWDPAPLEHPKFPHAEVYPNGRTVGETDPSRAIDARSVGRWRAMFSPTDEAQILAIAGALNGRLADLARAG